MMSKRLRSCSWFVALVLCLALVTSSVAQGTSGGAGALSGKDVLQSHQVGQMVVVKRTDGSKVRAKIVSVRDDAVVLRGSGGGNVEIAYKDIAKVQNGGLSRGAKGWIIGGVILVVLGILGTRV
jgi:hypothetical protein